MATKNLYNKKIFQFLNKKVKAEFKLSTKIKIMMKYKLVLELLLKKVNLNISKNMYYLETNF